MRDLKWRACVDRETLALPDGFKDLSQNTHLFLRHNNLDADDFMQRYPCLRSFFINDDQHLIVMADSPLTRLANSLAFTPRADPANMHA